MSSARFTYDLGEVGLARRALFAQVSTNDALSSCGLLLREIGGRGEGSEAGSEASAGVQARLLAVEKASLASLASLASPASLAPSSPMSSAASRSALSSYASYASPASQSARPPPGPPEFEPSSELARTPPGRFSAPLAPHPRSPSPPRSLGGFKFALPEACPPSTNSARTPTEQRARRPATPATLGLLEDDMPDQKAAAARAEEEQEEEESVPMGVGASNTLSASAGLTAAALPGVPSGSASAAGPHPPPAPRGSDSEATYESTPLGSADGSANASPLSTASAEPQPAAAEMGARPREAWAEVQAAAREEETREEKRVGADARSPAAPTPSLAAATAASHASHLALPSLPMASLRLPPYALPESTSPFALLYAWRRSGLRPSTPLTRPDESLSALAWLHSTPAYASRLYLRDCELHSLSARWTSDGGRSFGQMDQQAEDDHICNHICNRICNRICNQSLNGAIQ